MKKKRIKSVEKQKKTIKITRRQREIVQAASYGLTALEIAELLEISIKTVVVHKYNLFRSLQCKTMAGAVGMLMRRNMIK